MAKEKKADRAPAAPRTPEEYIEELRRRAVRRLVSTIVITGSVSGYVLTHWPQEEPVTVESMARVEWEVRKPAGPVERIAGCEPITAIQRFASAVTNTTGLRAPAPKCAG